MATSSETRETSRKWLIMERTEGISGMVMEAFLDSVPVRSK